MRLTSFFYLLLLTGHGLAAQDLKWNKGSIVLTSGSVITGSINLAPGHNLILFKEDDASLVAGRTVHPDQAESERTDGSVEALPAYKLSAVFFYDEALNINRRFMVIGDQQVYPGPLLYEAVLQGRINVLRRPRSFSTMPATPKDYDYYCNSDGKLIPLWKFYREVYPNMPDGPRQHLAAFIKANNLQKADDGNLITIIGYYNKMVKTGEALARYDPSWVESIGGGVDESKSAILS